MMNRRKFVGISAATALTGCARGDEMSRNYYAGPQVTVVEVVKSQRVLRLWSRGQVLRDYPVDLGFAPAGPKRFEGDGKTPEGSYLIDRRNPESDFYLSLGISYPNTRDVARARAAGRDPGKDIFIHGQGAALRRALAFQDWTAGCIALADADMREVYWMVRVGTPIVLKA